MNLTNLLTRDRVLWDVPVASKKRALETVAQLLCTAADTLTPDDIFDAMFERERLGCTDLGNGIALPHARTEGLSECVGALVRLAEPVHFDGGSGEPVRILLGVACPPQSEEGECEHPVDVLGDAARLLTDTDLGERLLAAHSDDDAWRLIVEACVLAPATDANQSKIGLRSASG